MLRPRRNPRAAGGPTVDDFDHDGDADLLLFNEAGSSILVNDGAHWGTPALLFHEAFSLPTGMTLVDVTGDGHLDVITLALQDSSGTGLLSVYPGGGTGAFGPATTYPAGQFLIPQRIVGADVDQDGVDDVVVELGTGDPAFLVYLSDSAGGLTGPTALLPGGGTDDAGGMSIGDFDEDGNLDILTRHIGLKQLRLLTGDGAGGFAEVALPADQGTWYPNMTTADFNGDGHLDLLNGSVVRFGDGTGLFPSQRNLAGGGSVTADFDGDGRPDVAITQSEPAKTLVYFNRLP